MHFIKPHKVLRLFLTWPGTSSLTLVRCLTSPPSVHLPITWVAMVGRPRLDRSTPSGVSILLTCTPMLYTWLLTRSAGNSEHTFADHKQCHPCHHDGSSRTSEAMDIFTNVGSSKNIYDESNFMIKGIFCSVQWTTLLLSFLESFHLAEYFYKAGAGSIRVDILLSFIELKNFYTYLEKIETLLVQPCSWRQINTGYNVPRPSWSSQAKCCCMGKLCMTSSSSSSSLLSARYMSIVTDAVRLFRRAAGGSTEDENNRLSFVASWHFFIVRYLKVVLKNGVGCGTTKCVS